MKKIKNQSLGTSNRKAGRKIMTRVWLSLGLLVAASTLVISCVAAGRNPGNGESAPTQTAVPSLPAMFTNPFAGPVPQGAQARLGKGTFVKLAYSPDGKTLAVASGVGIYFYSADTLRLRTFLDTAVSVTDIAFSPDGRTLASGSWDKTIILWDAASGKELQTLAGHGGTVLSVAFSPDGHTLASGSADGTILIWKLDNQ